uniref:U2 small nuclear ribonucleoprotein auxiliary factor subunit-related protein 1 n=1 Tax=Schistocephalus solidus TaxID=70667 RepID=A0A0X3Q9I4_SCHSO
MFAHFSLSAESRAPEEDHDDSLEVDEAALLSDYYEFYADVYGELAARWGRVLGFRTCCNRSEHLRGNVYVQFSDPAVVNDALRSCQNRWYAGRQVTGRIAYLGCGWKGAVCGLHHRGRCPKGNSMCNFLHVFTNPEETTRDLLLALSHNLPQLPAVQENHKRRRRRSNSSDSDLPPSSDPRGPSPSESRRSHDHRHYRHRRRQHQHRRRTSSRSPHSAHGNSPSARRHRNKHRRSRS